MLLDAGHRDGIHLVGDGEPDLLAYRERVAGSAEVLRAAGCGWMAIPPLGGRNRRTKRSAR